MSYKTPVHVATNSHNVKSEINFEFEVPTLMEAWGEFCKTFSIVGLWLRFEAESRSRVYVDQYVPRASDLNDILSVYEAEHQVNINLEVSKQVRFSCFKKDSDAVFTLWEVIELNVPESMMWAIPDNDTVKGLKLNKAVDFDSFIDLLERSVSSINEARSLELDCFSKICPDLSQSSYLNGKIDLAMRERIGRHIARQMVSFAKVYYKGGQIASLKDHITDDMLKSMRRKLSDQEIILELEEHYRPYLSTPEPEEVTDARRDSQTKAVTFYSFNPQPKENLFNLGLDSDEFEDL